MAEWSKALAWKVSIRQNRIEGSNPSRSATSPVSGPDTWVTDRTGDMGYKLAPNVMAPREVSPREMRGTCRPRVCPIGFPARYDRMADTIETLQQRMEAAVRALDFEEAMRCRDRINLMRGGATPARPSWQRLRGWSGSVRERWAWERASSK